MDTEVMLKTDERAMRADRYRQPGLGLAVAALALGCFTQKPSGESAPAAPAAIPEPEQPADVAPAPPVPASESLVEQKKDEPASGKGAAPPSPAAAPSGTSTPKRAPAKPAAKARSAGPEAAEESERAIGGNADEPERDAPALRQRLDRAYRAGSPDCPSARERKKAVCELATQICQLTDRDPNVASVAEYCSEAKQRCSQAERRTQERCPE